MAAPGTVEAEPHALLARVAQVTHDGIAIVRSGRLEWVNDALATMFSRDRGALLGADLAALGLEELAVEDEGRAIALDALCHDGSAAVTGRIAGSDGPLRAVAVRAVRLDLAHRRWLLTFHLVSEQIRAYEDLRASEAQFRALATNAPIGVFQSDHGVRLGYLNPRFAELWGREPEQLAGTGWIDAIHEDDRADVLAALARTLGGAEMSSTFRVEPTDDETRLVHARVVPVVRGDRSIGFVGSIEDVTATRRHEAQLHWQATHDPLTGLANRTELVQRIHEATLDGNGNMALLFFDLDDFKVVNDSLGHEAGDSLLCTIAERLGAVLRVGDMMARFGGDEFVVLCRGIEDETVAADIAERLLAELDIPVRLDGKPVRVTASVGIVVARGGSADTLLRDADLAMYQAKRAGKARIAVFDARERVRVEQHLDIVNGLRHALALGHVGVAYQPIVRQRDHRIVGAEALLRFEHPTLGPISALDVISLAERSGCIVELGTNVLTTACRDLAWWRRERGAAAPDYVAVNLAAVQLDQQDLVGLVVDRLERFGLVPGDLCLELTESQLMTDAERGDRVLSDLHHLGVQIAIDDFGTGYSSLAYLRRFPADVVKLDRSFVAGVASEPATAAIVRAVVSLTDTLGFTVAAEGVETREQLECVVDLGCELLQGYGLGRPVPPHEFPLEASWP